MKLSDGTIIAVRQATAEELGTLKWFTQYVFERTEPMPGDRAALYMASALDPFLTIETVHDALDVRAFLLAHSDDLPRIIAAILGQSQQQKVAQWVTAPIA